MTAAAAIRALAARPDAAGLFLDFDGTLAPIVDDPAASAMAPGLAQLLPGIAERLALVAVVSGRPVAFLAERAAVPGARLLGLYGLQEWSGGAAQVRPEAAPWQGAAQEARARLVQAVAGLPGVAVEDKGLSVAVHWRNAADQAAAGARVQELVRAEAARTGLAREPGKLVEELRPPVAWDKGATVAAVAGERRLATVVYIGDDLGDLAAFAAARACGGLALAVDHGAETPAQVRAAADDVLAGVQGVKAWLRQLAEALAV